MLRVNFKFLLSVSSYILTIYLSLYNKISFCVLSGNEFYKMKNTSTKRIERIEKKKKKMAALLEISRLNEYDRAKTAQTHLKCIETEPTVATLDVLEDTRSASRELEPKAKRFCSDTDLSVAIQDTTVVIQGCNSTEVELGISGKPKITGEDFLALKRYLREQTKRMRAQPKFRLREVGENAVLTVNVEDRIPLFFSDIQHLLMYSQLGHHSPYSPARWCQLEKFNNLSQTNVVIIENLSVYDYESSESLFPFLTSTFNVKLEVITSRAYKGDLIQDLATVPLTSTQMRKFITEFGTLEHAITKSNDLFDRIKNLFPVENADTYSTNTTLPKADKFPRTHLLLSGWQMVEENFPLPIKGLQQRKYAGYVLTKDKYKDVTSCSPMFGIDCEMCRTTSPDLELTRISIVDENMQVFYEQLVKPLNKIVDYLTQFSGITAKMMRGVTKTLKDVQQDIRRILPPDAILVGQSLSNDLHAMKMMHPYVIDTSVIYNITGERARKTKLQVLSREFLSERIQEGRSGHCSVEDSSASLKLAKLKLSHDLYFGDAVMSNVAVHIRHHPELGHPHYATSMLKQITKVDKTAQVIGMGEIPSKYHFYTYKDESKSNNRTKVSFTEENSRQSVINKLCETAIHYSFNVAHVRIPADDCQNNLRDTYAQIDKEIRQVYDYTCVSGLCIVIFGGKHETGNGCCFITIKRDL